MREWIQILKLSRPRFWLYLAGPFLIGYVAAISNLSDLVKPQFFLLFFYFLIPANILLYGVNDLADKETDALNPKKSGKEINLSKSKIHILKPVLVVVGIITLGVFAILPTHFWIIFISFIFLSIGYSLKPLRFKNIPVLDFFSNVLYAVPGFLAYSIQTGKMPDLVIILSAILRTSAMHLFSAVPDIEPDKKAGLRTSAVVFGRNLSLLLCSFFWLVSCGLIQFSGLLGFYSYLFILYPIIPIMLLCVPKTDINKVYWMYPYINAIFGFLLFLAGIEII